MRLCLFVCDRHCERSMLWRTLQAVDYGMRTSSKTVLVLSRQFLTDIWPCLSDMKSLSAMKSYQSGDSSLIVILTDSSCDVPRCLLDWSSFVDACCHYDHWWQKLSRLITASHHGQSSQSFIPSNIAPSAALYSPFLYSLARHQLIRSQITAIVLLAHTCSPPPAFTDIHCYYLSHEGMARLSWHGWLLT